MTHPLVLQLRFTRNEFERAAARVSDEDARKRILPMNCISWNIGHLAWQEQRYFLYRGQGKILIPEVQTLFAYGAPACTPPIEDAWNYWKTITATADPWLNELTSEKLAQYYIAEGGKPGPTTFGNLLQRTIYHYWYHTGENLAIRQMLGHKDLPEFVGDIDTEAPYRPEKDY